MTPTPRFVDTQGKPLKQTKVARAIFFVSADGEDWKMIHPTQVPDPLKHPDVMGYMMEGEIIETNEQRFYRVEKVN